MVDKWKTLSKVKGEPRSALKRASSIDGSLHLPLGVALFFIVMTGFAIWGFMRHWRFKVETQLRLDKCVGMVAQNFSSTLSSIESSNQKIEILRGIITFTPPQLRPPLLSAAQAVVVYQELLLKTWQFKQAQWIINRGCGVSGDWAKPLPTLSFIRSLPDLEGPKPLQWQGNMPEDFYFEGSNSNRIAAATVIQKGKTKDKLKGKTYAFEFLSKKWIAVWSPPSRFRWTDIH